MSSLAGREAMVAAVKVGPRARKDMGDLDALAASMQELGLLQPIGVTSDAWLVFGARRLEAAKRLGWKFIPVVTVDVDSLVAERDENEVRKGFTTSERLEIARQIEARVKEETPERRGRPKASEEGNSAINCGISPATGEETREFAAKAAGFGNRETMRKAELVVSEGTPELVEAMDKGDVSISAAARAAKLPAEEQKKAVAKARAEKAAKGKGKPKPKPAERTQEVRDTLGRVVPARLRDVFADRAVREQAERVKAWRKPVSAEGVCHQLQKRASAYPYIDVSAVGRHLNDALDALDAAASYVEANLPHAVCPECDGRGEREGDGDCDGCRRSGYVTAWRLDELRLEGRA